jgi:hypothetical protein
MFPFQPARNERYNPVSHSYISRIMKLQVSQGGIELGQIAAQDAG